MRLAAEQLREVALGASPMAITLKVLLLQCRLLLRKSSISFAERKTTLSKVIAIGREPWGCVDEDCEAAEQRRLSAHVAKATALLRSFCVPRSR